MSEITTEAPVYKATTFSNMNLQEVEAPVEQTPTETPSTVVPDTPAPETPTEQQAVETPAAEDNVSDFSLSFEGDQPATPVEEKVAPTVYNWKEEIKKVDKKELLKEAGIHDFALELNEYLLKGGKAQDYLNAKAIDYTQVSDAELMKDNLKKQFPNLTSQQVDIFFNKKYGVSEDALEDEKEFAEIQLKADAHLVRQQKIQEQQKFVIPETPILQKDEAYEQWKQMQESQPVMMERLKEYYQTHEATKTLNESKRVAISLGEGVRPFNFNVNQPEFLTRMWTDGGETLQKLMVNKSGEPDVAKQHLVGLFVANPQQFVTDIFNYGKQTGIKNKVEEGQNAQRPQQKVLPQELNSTPTYSTGKLGDRARN